MLQCRCMFNRDLDEILSVTHLPDLASSFTRLVTLSQ